MPPKKKTRQSSPVATSPADDEKSTARERTPQGPDTWTDEEEAALFKSMINWKPIGMHRHFRMIAIASNLQAQGVETEDQHTSTSGIWKKLNQLYNLESLRENEDPSPPPDGVFEDETFCDFDLPNEEYWDMAFARRNGSERPSSPLALAHQMHDDGTLSRRRQSTVEDTDDPRSSPPTARGSRSTRGRGGRKSQVTRESISADKLDADEASDDNDGGDRTGRGAHIRRSGRRK